MALLLPWWSTFDTSLVDNPEDHPFFNLNPLLHEANTGRVNCADMTETEREYKIEMEVPGFQKPEISIEFNAERTGVTIKGKRESEFEEESEGKEKEARPKSFSKRVSRALGKSYRKRGERQEGEEYPKYWVSERIVDEFSRSFSFQNGLDVDKATAKLESGVLTVIIPKVGAARVESKRISIA